MEKKITGKLVVISLLFDNDFDDDTLKVLKESLGSGEAKDRVRQSCAPDVFNVEVLDDEPKAGNILATYGDALINVSIQQDLIRIASFVDRGGHVDPLKCIVDVASILWRLVQEKSKSDCYYIPSIKGLWQAEDKEQAYNFFRTIIHAQGDVASEGYPEVSFNTKTSLEHVEQRKESFELFTSNDDSKTSVNYGVLCSLDLFFQKIQGGEGKSLEKYGGIVEKSLLSEYGKVTKRLQ